MRHDPNSELHNEMRRRLRTGITPAQFEMDALRLVGMQLRPAARYGIENRRGTAVDLLQSKVSRFVRNLLYGLRNFVSHGAKSGDRQQDEGQLSVRTNGREVTRMLASGTN